MTVFSSTLPSPGGLPVGMPYTVVVNTVFQELARREATLEEHCDCFNVSSLQPHKDLSWLPSNEKVWTIPASKAELELGSSCDLVTVSHLQSSSSSLNNVAARPESEGGLVKALADRETILLLGYYQGNLYDEWISFEADKL
ncbi:hypothetical protein FSARC_14166 [Fusarium sarcochroum]|uniref:Uncharacterized protein n=1 Tax=Fusarium sarcochroum TaxID=1208366 RepID=A0A8H4WQ28_9HYPO|nr:hypothetical protein FSARC_14166 [Fusarium sarcochroum]